MAAEAISAAFSFSAWQKKFHGLLSAGTIPLSLDGLNACVQGGPKDQVRGVEEKVLLLLPSTYMNESGRAVQAACTFHKIPPENVIVLHDEIELQPGKIRVKQGGGHAGHNGLKSIDAAIGQNYWRVRLGVGRPPHAEMETADYVLSNFSAEEKKWLKPFLQSIAAHFPLLLAGQPSELMNKVTLDMKPVD